MELADTTVLGTVAFGVRVRTSPLAPCICGGTGIRNGLKIHGLWPCGFDSRRMHHSFIAQLAERTPDKGEAGGSIPPETTNRSLTQQVEYLAFNQNVKGSRPLRPTIYKSHFGVIKSGIYKW